MKMVTKQNLMHAIYPRKCNTDAEGRYVFVMLEIEMSTGIGKE